MAVVVLCCVGIFVGCGIMLWCHYHFFLMILIACYIFINDLVAFSLIITGDCYQCRNLSVYSFLFSYLVKLYKNYFAVLFLILMNYLCGYHKYGLICACTCENSCKMLIFVLAWTLYWIICLLWCSGLLGEHSWHNSWTIACCSGSLRNSKSSDLLRNYNYPTISITSSCFASRLLASEWTKH